jgi:glutamate synthase (NADPH/NADH) large chain
MQQPPFTSGLYDPSTEHDSCGVGFVAHIRGEKSRAIIEDALEVLRRMAHRAACGCDPETGDGAGILVQIPHRFFKRIGRELGWDMPKRRRYGIGQVFLPSEPAARRACEALFEQVIAEEGQHLVGWRDVPVEDHVLGRVARSVAPTVRQVFIARRRVVPSAFERKLYVIRKRVENLIRERGVDPDGRFHVASLSAETIIYKGLLLPSQLPRFYPDLQEPDMVSGLALVHSRFSTNTFPTWDLAQPFRYIAHNGEINTVRGNRNWMNARRQLLQSAKFGGPLDRLFPIIVPGGSDSAQFDNMLELLVLGGRSVPHAMMMMIPEAWEHNPQMDDARRAFYEYSASLLEPWDGPAAMAFTDGHLIGATLDRNGLRPARYVVTEDDRVILSSEVGVIDLPDGMVREKGRLRPGRMFLVDTREGRIIDDAEIKRDITGRWPYRRWLSKNVLSLSGLPDGRPRPVLSREECLVLQRAQGYTDEDLRIILEPMAREAEEPVGSMGTDTPLAVLSQRAPLLYDYFHQLFAQVTNPPIDPIRESLVMNLETTVGPEGNPFDETPDQCHRLAIGHPLLSNADLARILEMEEGALEARVLPICFPVAEGPAGLQRAVDALCVAAVEAIDEGVNILVLSDRGVDAALAPIPSLLAVSAVHHHLVREGLRMHAGLVVESGDAREVHHFALLLGYGAAAVNPYLALESVRQLALDGDMGIGVRQAEANYAKAVGKGLLKVMSKMGISTLASYRGAQIFEAVGLDRPLIDGYFTGTVSRLAGVGCAEIGREVIERHARGFSERGRADVESLPTGGVYQWRRRGEVHKWNPSTIARLQAAVRSHDEVLFQEYCRLVDEESEARCTLRGLLEIDDTGCTPVPLDQVESAASLARRFVTGAMSFGSISAEAHENLAIAMNRLGAKSNSGEGGEEAGRYVPDANGDLRRSAIKQVASARFGVTAEYLVHADDLQIKMAQGAKPGEGGQLPGHKVSERIAKVRCSTPGVTLISPPPHHDIYSIEDLAQLIHDLKAVNPTARVSVKLVSEAGVGTVAAGVTKALADVVVIAGDTGGTGAAPLSSIKHAGLPWELGLAEAQQVLVHNDLRGRVKLQVDGGLRTPRDVIVGGLLGAEEFGFATAALISSGCMMLRKCHNNTCSVGIATQDERLRARFAGRPEHIVSLFMMLAEGVRSWMARLGARRFDELVGRADLLKIAPQLNHWKAERLDLRAILAQPEAGPAVARRHSTGQGTGLDHRLDQRILAEARRALEGGPPVSLTLPITNQDRSVGARLSGHIALHHGARGLVDDTIRVNFTGSAGQSFGAFLASGVTFVLDGDANDYVGKGLSGGCIAVRPPRAARFAPEHNILIGNTVLYGATSGSAFFNGVAGERFAVRNSGARAVVEGVGDHGCEYMTGGAVVVLGEVGRNFAAGMSGGMAFVLDRERDFRSRCNTAMVELERLEDASDIWLVRGMIEEHLRLTASPLARRVLDTWESTVHRFVKVMPTEYKRALELRRVQALTPPTTSNDLTPLRRASHG